LLMPFVITARTNNKGNGIDDALPTVCAGTIHHALIQGAAQLSMRDANAMRVAGLERELMTQGCGQQRRSSLARHSGELLRPGHNFERRSTRRRRRCRVKIITARRSRAELRVDDCYFRMLQPHEIGAAMAFPTTYEVLGNKRDRVKQYGNAVTPPAMETLIERNVQSMTGDRAA
jgi:DNA (cytosine-5)-methyltransferase 1